MAAVSVILPCVRKKAPAMSHGNTCDEVLLWKKLQAVDQQKLKISLSIYLFYIYTYIYKAETDK